MTVPKFLTIQVFVRDGRRSFMILMVKADQKAGNHEFATRLLLDIHLDQDQWLGRAL